MTLNGSSVTPTSTYPYISIGPVDFSNYNFVKTKQTDYYYCFPFASSTTAVVCSTVEQSYDATTATLMIAGMIISFFLILGWGMRYFKNMGK